MNVVDKAPAVAAGTQVIALADERYPPLLREIHDPPPCLYVRGDPAYLLRPQLAIVGARRASPVALRLAANFAARAVDAGITVTSGLALGIDGAAHRGALEAGGSSVAVMATGVETIYPRRHLALGEALIDSGCLVSEFPPGTPPRKGNFPTRNRVISGLSLGVLLVEAALPSGSLITAGTALEQGREVFALPWSIAHQGGAGCLRLLRDGAKMVLSFDDILEELDGAYTRQRELFPAGQSQGAPELPDNQQALLALVGCEPVSVDELSSASGLASSQVLAGLSALELEGLVCRTAGGYTRG